MKLKFALLFLIAILTLSLVSAQNYTNETTYFGQMQPTVCPNTMAYTLNTLIFIMLSLGLILIGFIYSKILGIFGSLAMLMTAFTVSACNGFIGFILGLMGVLLLVVFAFRKK